MRDPGQIDALAHVQEFDTDRRVIVVVVDATLVEAAPADVLRVGDRPVGESNVERIRPLAVFEVYAHGRLLCSRVVRSIAVITRPLDSLSSAHRTTTLTRRPSHMPRYSVTPSSRSIRSSWSPMTSYTALSGI